MSKNDLFQLLTKQGTATLVWDGVWYILIGIDREDGSGQCFNLTVRSMDTNLITQIYMRTIP